jgi:hypothetical protein
LQLHHKAADNICIKYSSTYTTNSLVTIVTFPHCAAAGHSLAVSAWGGLIPFMISGIVMLIQPSALAAGLLVVVTGLVSWAAAVPLINLMPHINARGVRPAPQLALARDLYRHLAGMKGARHRKKQAAADAAAEAEAAAAGDGTVRHASSEDR